MILAGFLTVCGLLLGSAAMAGRIDACVNLDSLALVLAGTLVSGLVFSAGEWKNLGSGFMTMIRFRRVAPSAGICRVFTGMAVAVVIFGFLSMMQGIYSGLLAAEKVPLETTVWYASYTVFYSFLVSGFLLLPVVLKHKAR